MTNFKNVFLISLLGMVIINACNNTPDNNNDTQNALPDPLVTNRDTTVNPVHDFFMYANGGWFKQHPIPASESSNGIFDMIGDTINSQILQICKLAAADTTAAKGSNWQKIGDFYASGMDTANIDKVGLSPLTEPMQRIDNITDVKSLMTTIAYLRTIGVYSAFSFYVGQDDKMSSVNAIFLGQCRVGLGDRDYYFDTDARTTNIRNEYIKHLQAMLQFTGDQQAATNAQVVMKIETDLAKASRKMEGLRDPEKNYNKMAMAQCSKAYPNTYLTDVLTVLGITNADSIIVGQPEFFEALDKLVKKYSTAQWKSYLKWSLLNTYAEYLNTEIETQNFKFYHTIMNGITEQKPRWKRVVETTNYSLGELIGQIYVSDYLPKGSKEKLLEIGNSIRDVYAQRIKNLDWMSQPTKEKALDKLSKIVMKVGYPDKWKDMSELQPDRSSYCANMIQSFKWNFNNMVRKYGKPVDRNEWHMYPQTYNAYYSPANNEIVVPACNILVPGFEGRMPDDAILYGIIGGSTFGHEITHGFDDQGSQYDQNGNLNNWWTAEDRQKFKQKTKRIVEQFDSYIALDSLHLNGDATQGENIADLGGVVMGYEAFKLTQQYKQNQIISGLTPDQRYFLAYGYAWMINLTNEALARKIMTDVHSPAKFRVNGPLSNISQFYTTFGVKQGDAMYRADSLRVAIW